MTNRTSLLAASASAFALLATAPAFAQDNDDVIIVSATKRNTTLQETPVAVTVTSADVIEKAQILDIKDLQTVVPTFRVSQLQNAGNTTLSVRGFGNGGNNIGIEPSVGLFIDGVYRSRAAAQIGDLPRLDRVEVVSGPQSTLFGKNASTGVVSIVTSKPDYEANGYVEGGIGNYGLNYAKGYITGGLTDNLAISLGGGYQSRDGYFEPAAGTKGGDFNDLNRYNLRAQALWEPTEDFSARVIWDRSVLDENCCGVATAIVGPTSAIVGALGGQIPTPTDPFSYETAVNSKTVNDITDGGLSLEMNWNLDLLGGVTVTSITSDRSNEYDYDSDSDFNTLSLLESTFQLVGIDTFTQELRLTSDNSGPLAWMIGGYYFNESIEQNSGIDYGSDLRPYIDALAGGPAALGGIEAVLGFAPGTFFSDDVRIDETFNQDNEALSIFGTVDFDVTDRLTVTVGGNYTEDKKDVSGSTVNNDTFSNLTLTGAQGTQVISTGIFLSGAPGVPSFSAALGGLPFTPANFAAAQAGTFGPAAQGYINAVLGASAGLAASPTGPLAGLLPLQFQPQFVSYPNSVEDGKTRDDDFTYTLKAGYEINDNFNAYISTATGFKASSFNLTRDSRPLATDLAALQTAGLLPNNYNPTTGRNSGTRFSAPEEVTVYEFGLKGRFDWGSFSLAVFDQTIDNFQSTIFQGTGFVLANAGSQSTQGIEFDSKIKPVDGLTLGFGGIIQDPVYDDFANAPGAGGTVVDLSGEKPAGINELALSVSAQYDFALSDSIDAYVRGDWQYEDEVQIVDNIIGLNRDTSTFNGSLGFTLDDSLDVRFWGRNLFDHETFTSAFPGVVQAGTVNAYPNQPRTYGVSLRKNF
jgi:iron complex outermembrane receptor protein